MGFYYQDVFYVAYKFVRNQLHNRYLQNKTVNSQPSQNRNKACSQYSISLPWNLKIGICFSEGATRARSTQSMMGNYFKLDNFVPQQNTTTRFFSFYDNKVWIGHLGFFI